MRTSWNFWTAFCCAVEPSPLIDCPLKLLSALEPPDEPLLLESAPPLQAERVRVAAATMPTAMAPVRVAEPLWKFTPESSDVV